MPFNADLAGATWGPLSWRATTRRILAYRAALAPDRSAGLDDLTPGGLPALPMAIVTPEWALALLMRADPGQTLTEDEGHRAVHAAQDTRFLRPIRPDALIETTARLVGVRHSRAGVVAVSELVSREVGGETVAVTLSTSIYRGAALSGAETPPPPTEALDFATEPERTPLSFPAGFPHLYSECADIWNPIHTERAVARAAGLADIIVHGTALWAMAGLAVADRYLDGEPLALKRLAARFTAPVLTGSTPVLEHVRDGAGAAFRLVGAQGEAQMLGRADF